MFDRSARGALRPQSSPAGRFLLAVVVGGTTLKGGKGSVLRTVMGVLLVILMSNCLNLLGVTPYLQVVLKGAILVLAIWLDNRTQL